ncbi:MAG: hypothetical protein RIF33_10125 [Cyclobacteriaceae bacterium]
MKQLLRKYLPESLQGVLFDFLNNRDLKRWTNAGKPFPPPNVIKQMMVEEYSEKHHAEVLIETGTYLGSMIFAQRHNFKQIYSIELAEVFWTQATRRFKSHDHINIVLGNSADRMSEVIEKSKGKILFWLDGHFSGGGTAESQCPVMDELDAIINDSRQHVILIDDARCFGVDDYPTLEEIETFLKQKTSEYQLDIKDDVIRIVYQKQSISNPALLSH